MLLTTMFPGTATAGVFACQSNDRLVYQDRPCPQNKAKKVITDPSNHTPLGIHESWFDVPEQAFERAYCDRRGCECGDTVKKHQGSLIDAVADALYLDGSWHRYESNHASWLEAPSNSSEYFELQDQMLEAACDVMMSQSLLLSFAKDVLAQLNKRVARAEELGFDDELPCQQEIAEACSYFASVQLFARFQKDAIALHRDRKDDVVPATGASLPADR